MSLQTKQNRIKERKRIQQRAATAARGRALESYMSMRCWDLHVLNQLPSHPNHKLCKKADCLCECHDPATPEDTPRTGESA